MEFVDFHPENCLIFDDNNYHYFWRSIDWVNQKRVNNTHVYVRIKNEKIYIEEDWTEEEFYPRYFDEIAGFEDFGRVIPGSKMPELDTVEVLV